MSIHLVYAFVDAASMILVLVISGRMLYAAPRHPASWLIAWLAFNSICNLLSARQDYAFTMPPEFSIEYGGIYILLNLARNASSVAMMLLCHTIFRDGERFPRWLLGLAALQFFVEEPLGWIIEAWWVSNWTANSTPAAVLINEMVPAALQLLFSSLAVYWALQDYNADLVAKRRVTRAVLLLLLAGFVSLVIERLGFFSGLVPFTAMYHVHMQVVALQVLVMLLIVFGMMRGDLAAFIDPAVKPQAAAAAIAPEPDSTAADVQRVRNALEEEKIYRTMGLSVRDLAVHLSIPEYRLRSLIHNHMDFRNFNSLLHHYRIAEVCAALQDPAQNSTPVLTLALSAGYQSIAPFNRAFKQLMQQTPTEYRQRSQQQAASAPAPTSTQTL